MRITLLIGSLANTGGSERSISMLANSWAERGRAVTLIVFDGDRLPAYALHPSVKCRHLDLYGSARGFLKRIRRMVWTNGVLRQAIRESQPDIVISFTVEPNVRTVLATRGSGIPVVISERTDPRLYDIGRKWNTLRRLAYPFADMLVCQTTTCLNRFQKITRPNGCVIPNLIAVPPALVQRRVSKVGRKDHVLIAMGRLVPQKGFDLLLEAFSSIAARHPNWSLKILGSGPLRSELQSQAASLSLVDRIHFAGTHVEPFDDLRQADLFVFSSRFEGFGNALCEAMACGLPAVSFDCPSGPRDIIRHGIDGILVPPEDTRALAAALDELMGNSQKREQFAARAPEILERFNVEWVLSMWDKALAELVPAKMKLKSASEETAFSTGEII